MQELYSSNKLITLQMVWDDYRKIRRLKPETERVYSVCINRCFGDWRDLPVHLITQDMIEHRHRYMSNLHGRWKGEAQANLAMRVLRALLTFAAYKYSELAELAVRNPVKRLTEVRAWNKISRRRRSIANQLPQWFATLRTLPDRKNRDFHLLLLLTGLRKNEAASLTWNMLDEANAFIAIEQTKNGDRHELPLSTQLVDLLRSRRQLPDVDPLFVFASHPLMQLSPDYRGYQMVSALSGVEFHFHDLRRSFATIADDLDISERVIKRLLNHRSNDVTQGYICNGVERLRAPMQLISDEILRRAQVVDFSGWL